MSFPTLTAPGTASASYGLVGSHQVGLLTSWEAAKKYPVAAEERPIDIYIDLCVLYFI